MVPGLLLRKDEFPVLRESGVRTIDKVKSVEMDGAGRAAADRPVGAVAFYPARS